MSLLPADDQLELLHTRDYSVRVYLLDDTHVLVRGVVSDVKPPGLYVTDDVEPLEIHQMHVELTVELSTMEITAAEVVFETHPNETCPSIADHYRQLVGLTIARGFTHRVRELFGGPRGCTHTTALLQAMAPAVVQSTWSVHVRSLREAGGHTGEIDGAARERQVAGNINTCHVWAEDGEHVTRLQAGEPPPPLLQIASRLEKLGRDPSDWPGG
ncbi:MAG: DUF2889 domain-containing protein [Acidimicrobiia bacterium]|nr:DUF2889 domain-containing protein [Acidimicrobiia bacterium]